MNPAWAGHLLAGAGLELYGMPPERARLRDDQLVWHGGGEWPAPLESTNAEHAASWLDARYPPDCHGGRVEGNEVLLYGAIGSVAYAIEERFPVEGGSSLFNTLRGSLAVAGKASTVAEAVMPRREFGWRRPFLVVGSAADRTGRVMAWDRELGDLVMEPVLSDLWLSVVHDPRDAGSYSILVRRMAATFQQSFLSWTDDLIRENS